MYIHIDNFTFLFPLFYTLKIHFPIHSLGSANINRQKSFRGYATSSGVRLYNLL